jgi:hypothetical protein
MEINNKKVIFPRYTRAIVDSGTTLIVFTHASFNLVVAHLQEHYCDVPGLCDVDSWFRPAHCTKISEADRLRMPTLRFHLDGFDVLLTPNEYLINYESKGPDYWCVGLMALDSLSGGIDVIFGNTVMKKYVTVYDRENQRLGFGESKGDCIGSVAAAQTAPLPALTTDEEYANRTSPTTTSAPDGKIQSQANAASGGGGQIQQKSDPGAVFVDAAKCQAAKDCSSCAAVDGSGETCVWISSEAQCYVGEKIRFMCLLDAAANELLYIVIGTSCLLVLVIIGCACCCVRRKVRDAEHEAALDPEEAVESRVPLAPVRRDARAAANQFELEDSVEEF